MLCSLNFILCVIGKSLFLISKAGVYGIDSCSEIGFSGV